MVITLWVPSRGHAKLKTQLHIQPPFSCPQMGFSEIVAGFQNTSGLFRPAPAIRRLTRTVAEDASNRTASAKGCSSRSERRPAASDSPRSADIFRDRLGAKTSRSGRIPDMRSILPQAYLATVSGFCASSSKHILPVSLQTSPLRFGWTTFVLKLAISSQRTN
jgi:hypothetical protein